jgi:uncharacterized protein YegP (UPF0339 family)
MKGERIEVYEAKNGEWYYRWKAANNETRFGSEGYTTQHTAREAAEWARRHSPEVPIHEVES